VLSKGCEWKESQLIIAGEYMTSKPREVKPIEKENVILIASQKTLHDLFIPKIEQIAKSLSKHPNWRIILKLHPLEKEIEKYNRLTSQNLEIAPLSSNISDYLEIAKIQLSIYSTTFFDAIGFDVVNYAWDGPFIGGDYAESLIEDGIARSANIEDIILNFNDINPSETSFLSRAHFYSPFSSESFDA
jgi:hypothetical protein